MLKEASSLRCKGQIDDAAVLCRNALAQNPQNADALHLLGVIEAQRKNFLIALGLMDRAIELDPNNAGYLSNRGLALQHLNRFEEALASYDRALEIKPDYVNALNNRGVVLYNLKRPGEALASYDSALAVKPDYAEAFNNRGLVLQQLHRFDEALASYDRALAIKPDYVDARINRGIVLHNLERPGEALASYESALAIKPDYAEGFNNRGLVLQRLHRFDDALASYDRALAIKPDYADALNNRAVLLHKLGRFEDALASYDRALAIKADSVEILNNRGVTLHKLNRFDDALASYDRALAIKPDFGQGVCNRGHVFRVQGGIAEAVACFRRAVKLTDNASVHSSLIFGLNFDPSASASEKQCERTRWDEQHARPLSPCAEPHDNDTDPDRRLRIGYVSNYFRRQAATYAFGGVMINHDAKLFEVFCYSDTVIEDDVTARLRRRADRWHDTAGLSDEQLAELIRRDRIDVLVDLVGHMTGHRLLVFARKPAPIQVTAWGEPTGTGLKTMDYLLADATLVEKSEEALLSERVVNLPNFLGYWTPELLPEAGPLPALAQGYITFGSFNRLDKITRPTLHRWASILRKLPTARLLLKDEALTDAAQRTRLRDAFVSEGISAERLNLLGGSDRPAHFTAYHGIDIALDPFPHGGGMTTLDALWMGVPVVTWAGETISSRLAAASLSALGLRDFVADSPEAYADLAVAKAADVGALIRLRSTLRARIAASEFGDGVRYSRAVESAYREMWQRWCSKPASCPH